MSMYAREDSPQPTTTRLAQTSDGMTLAAENVRMHERMKTKNSIDQRTENFKANISLILHDWTEERGQKKSTLYKLADTNDTTLSRWTSEGISSITDPLKRFCEVTGYDSESLWDKKPKRLPEARKS